MVVIYLKYSKISPFIIIIMHFKPFTFLLDSLRTWKNENFINYIMVHILLDHIFYFLLKKYFYMAILGQPWPLRLRKLENTHVTIVCYQLLIVNLLLSITIFIAILKKFMMFTNLLLVTLNYKLKRNKNFLNFIGSIQ